ncbi:helix-turn-helix transcriptional regulator [Actinomadura rudentiformis]|uniref:AAA family ATPase n=1 Tax=Actinomadura rudentiformis TaxID=359158 RepID=A0A6H9YEP0_9ACTN|nr:helix-turn-helix transcriptional regulator [Actinomadura rudentiformis]KAB2342164.1 AAA family ATPase [Actinomadura rudentiformis]
MLYGRAGETGQIDRLLSQAHDGRSAAVVVRGEAGIGKSALLDYAAGAAGTGMRVLRVIGVEAESDLPFAGLSLLLSRVADRIGRLPGRQAHALRGALGLEDSPAADRFLTGLALLTFLGDLAEERPLLVLVDDAHWLDQASADALLFAARRLGAEGVVLLFAARDVHAPPFPAPGIAELRLAGLDGAAAAELLAEHAGDLPRYAREQIMEEARGNPLAFRELPAAQREGQIAEYLGAMPDHARIQRTFADRIAVLPEPTRMALLVAAAEGTGDLTAVVAAAGRLGAGVDDLEPAERKDLVRLVDGRLAFRHPLIRAAAYQSAPIGRRLAAHRALADALPCVGNIDRRAWHLAAATSKPDEYVASVLEQTAEFARARGGYAAVAAAYDRAAQLSTETPHRVRRLALAARAAADAGQVRRAAEFATQAGPHVTEPLMKAELAQVRAFDTYVRRLPKTAHTLLVDAALGVIEAAPAKAAFMLFDAMGVIWATGDAAATRETAARIGGLRLSRHPEAGPFIDAALAMSHLVAGDPAAGMPALRTLMEDGNELLGGLALLERACAEEWAVLTGDLAVADDLSTALVAECREQGAIGVLPESLRDLARIQLFQGRHHDARATATETLRMAEDTDQIHYADDARGILAHLAATEGDEDTTRRLAAEVRERGNSASEVWTASALALLDLGLGRHEDALRRREELGADVALHSIAGLYTLPDHVEAAARLGRPERAAAALDRFEAWAKAAGVAWAEAVSLRCRALLAPDEEAGRLYARAVEIHHGCGRPFERARTELLYGEWLRRSGHRSGARRPLRTALEIFERLGAAPWAERARGELRATGETRPARDSQDAADLLGRLTPQELQVVRLAATGMTNRDIGAQLFLSPRTVGYHLYNAYPKLGVSSRGELASLATEPEPQPA